MKYKKISMNIHPELYEKIKLASKEADTNLSSYIRSLLTALLGLAWEIEEKDLKWWFCVYLTASAGTLAKLEFKKQNPDNKDGLLLLTSMFEPVINTFMNSLNHPNYPISNELDAKLFDVCTVWSDWFMKLDLKEYNLRVNKLRERLNLEGLKEV